jgi:hypothetical protein
VLAEPGAPLPEVSEDTVFRLPADMALREADPLARWSRAYAADEALFVRDFQRAMQRMMQLGAGRWFELDASYTWKGYKGDFEGFGTAVPPLDDDA